MRALTNWIERHGWHYHDCSEDDALWARRGWLSPQEAQSPEISYEVYVWPRWKRVSAQFEVSQRSLRWSASLWAASLYLKLGGVLNPEWTEKILPGEDCGGFTLPHGQVIEPYRSVESAETGFFWMDGTLHWSIWQATNTWKHTDARWHRGSWTPMDTMFGKTEYRKRSLPWHRISFEMDGITYSPLVSRRISAWRRPRARKVDIRRTIEFYFDAEHLPPKFNGKGENAWDCGDDGIFGVGIETDSLKDAIEKYKLMVMRDRKKYGAPSDLAGAWR